jgi:hypothetical protein
MIAVLVVAGLVAIIMAPPGRIATGEGHVQSNDAAGAVGGTTPGQDEAGSGGSTTVNTVQKVTQSVQSVLTALAIVFGGAWALYTFVLGRTVAGTVQIQVETKSFISKLDKQAAVVSVLIKNIGRTLITKEHADIQVMPVTDEHLKLHRPAMRLMHASLDPTISRVPALRGYPRSLPLFEARVGRLEPGEEVSEDILLLFGEHQTAKVEVRFFWLSLLRFQGPTQGAKAEALELTRDHNCRRIGRATRRQS